MTYEGLKNWYAENKEKVVLTGCFVLVFVVGFGAGRYVQPSTSSGSQINYTTNSSKKPFFATTPTAGGEAGDTTPAVAGTSTTSSVGTGPCLIKGNVSANKKIYHVPGGAFYARVKAEQCFNTEAEAQAAGFVKSQR